VIKWTNFGARLIWIVDEAAVGRFDVCAAVADAGARPPRVD